MFVVFDICKPPFHAPFLRLDEDAGTHAPSSDEASSRRQPRVRLALGGSATEETVGNWMGNADEERGASTEGLMRPKQVAHDGMQITRTESFEKHLGVLRSEQALQNLKQNPDVIISSLESDGTTGDCG